MKKKLHVYSLFVVLFLVFIIQGCSKKSRLGDDEVLLTIKIITPIIGQEIERNLINHHVTVSGIVTGINLKSLSYVLNDGAVVYVPSFDSSSSNFTFDLDFSALAEGDSDNASLTVTVKDESGEEASQTISFKVNMNTDLDYNQAFLNAPKFIVSPASDDFYAIKSRKFTGIPSIVGDQKGRLWATWYSGSTPKEDRNNYVVVAISDNEGKDWKEVLVVDPDKEGEVRAFDPEIWIDPLGKLWLFWAQHTKYYGTKAGVWALNIESDGQGIKWGQARRLTDGVMMCKPTVLKTGEWLLPASDWKFDNSARAVISKDKGKTWKLEGAAHVPEEDRTVDEHMVIEKNDGSLWMLVRTLYGIGESFSTDKGKSWTTLQKSAIQHPSARFFIRKLNSGNLLLVKHGPINTGTKRSHLTAFISKDDGTTWSDGLLLDERGVTYPDGFQDHTGRVYIVYDRDRKSSQEIIMTSFTEQDILESQSDKIVNETIYNNRRTVSQGGR